MKTLLTGVIALGIGWYVFTGLSNWIGESAIPGWALPIGATGGVLVAIVAYRLLLKVMLTPLMSWVLGIGLVAAVVLGGISIWGFLSTLHPSTVLILGIVVLGVVGKVVSFFLGDDSIPSTSGEILVTCPHCGGAGYYTEYGKLPCGPCKGSGFLRR